MRKRQEYNLELAIGMGKYGRNVLLDFINCLPNHDGFERFKKLWERREKDADGYVYTLLWDGDLEHFKSVQREARAIWEGKKKGHESVYLNFRLGLDLGFTFSADSDEGSHPHRPPIHANWSTSSLRISPNHLEHVVWLALLQHSHRLGICENNKTGDCLTPYFLKYRASTRFCSEVCAQTTQRESKRRWWKEHGSEWLKKRALVSNSRGRKKI